MINWLIYIAAAMAEIAGCFSFWLWLKHHQSMLWILPGILSLVLFAYLLTLITTDHAGRAYAAYGGIYIASALLWLWIVEGTQPTLTDVCGTLLCLVGTAIILLGPKTAPFLGR